MTALGTTAGSARGDWSAAGSGASVLLIADAGVAGDAENAIMESGLRLLSRVAWGDVALRLEQQGLVSVVLAEAAGADDAVLAQVLPAIDALAMQHDVRIVVTLRAAQIDVVAANLHAPHAALLCDPTPAERFVALCLARHVPGAAVHDIRREGEAASLRRLNEEVARIAETLARLTRDDPGARADDAGASAVGERTLGYRAPPPAADTPEITARAIRDAIRARRLRDQFFGAGLFEDPAWDMLLDLFAAELESAQVSVSSLCIAAAVAPTTALRWIARMTDAGLFERQPDPFDRRRAFMGLSERASAGMRSYVAAARRAGLAIA